MPCRKIRQKVTHMRQEPASSHHFGRLPPLPSIPSSRFSTVPHIIPASQVLSTGICHLTSQSVLLHATKSIISESGPRFQGVWSPTWPIRLPERPRNTLIRERSSRFTLFNDLCKRNVLSSHAPKLPAFSRAVGQGDEANSRSHCVIV